MNNFLLSPELAPPPPLPMSTYLQLSMTLTKAWPTYLARDEGGCSQIQAVGSFYGVRPLTFYIGFIVSHIWMYKHGAVSNGFNLFRITKESCLWKWSAYKTSSHLPQRVKIQREEREVSFCVC
jgi:hypothetical protein